MEYRQGWFYKPLRSLFLLGALCIVSFFVITNSQGRREWGDEVNYRISIRHYGIDAREMESSAAIPLEDALSAIPGINRIITQSENGMTRAYASFKVHRRGFIRAEHDYYDSVREAAQRVYEQLPASAQRPEISSAGDFRIPFWTAAVYGSAGSGIEAAPDGLLLDRIIKPALSGIEGVGEVEIAGPGALEITIILDQEKTAALGLHPGVIAQYLASNDGLFSGGTLYSGGLEIPILLDALYADAAALGEALIPVLTSDGRTSYIRLTSIAEVQEQERSPDTLTRLNGKKTAIISLSSVSGADLGALSQKIMAEIESFSYLPLEFHVLEDRGFEETRAFRSVRSAALQASLLVALAVIVLGLGKFSKMPPEKNFRNGLFCAAAVPLILLVSAALLSTLGFPLNRRFLAGLSIGIGAAVDGVIISAQGFGRAGKNLAGSSVMKGIWSPLVLGAFTSVAVLLPLLNSAEDPDLIVFICALGVVSIVSVVFALGFLPPLFMWDSQSKFRSSGFTLPIPKEFVFCLRKISRQLNRCFSILINLSYKKPYVFPCLGAFLSIVALFCLTRSGTDPSGDWAEDSVYVQIEFEGGFLKEEGDLLLAPWAEQILHNPAVKDIQTGARIGSGYALISFDPLAASIMEIREFVHLHTIPGAFIFIPEPSPQDRIWTIIISGDEDEICRDLAREAASLCAFLPSVSEAVLNFKPGGPRLSLSPRREILAQGSFFFSAAGETLRRGIHGPVAYKRTNEGERDVRIMFNSIAGKEGVLDIPLS
ncbi:MAG: efflux RND transporter permease subunit, partial [Treponema sp.]|nr:efflux RND transporter permease subunit [Treponema sp.]